MFIVFVASERVLFMVSPDPKVSEYAYQYVLSLIPAAFLLGQHDLLRRFMIQMDKSNLTMYS